MAHIRTTPPQPPRTLLHLVHAVLADREITNNAIRLIRSVTVAAGALFTLAGTALMPLLH
jgi:hypothetical protein